MRIQLPYQDFFRINHPLREMRLIDTATLEPKEFLGKPPEYAILSHTWGEDEVTYQHFHDTSKRVEMKGWVKIEFTRRAAQRINLKYIWVDTCCIDKSSSAELTESINSMFKWYQDAKICFAYLEDVTGSKGLEEVLVASLASNPDIRVPSPRSRWLTRGWTLQELIAPSEVQFFGRNWTFLGSRDSLAWDLARLTRIPLSVLTKKAALSTFSVAQRMSWASDRETSREEDTAYCLMGLFDVNMPMLYGEGSKAFSRLQEEILKQTDDESIFAWRCTEAEAQKAPYQGIFARSPAEFAESGDVNPRVDLYSSRILSTVTSRGVAMSIRKLYYTHCPRHRDDIRNGYIDNEYLLRINCESRIWGTTARRLQNSFFIMLICRGGDQFVRCHPDEFLAYKPFRCQPVLKPDTSEDTIYIAKYMSIGRISEIVDPAIAKQDGLIVTSSNAAPSGVTVTGVYPKSASFSPSLSFVSVNGLKLAKFDRWDPSSRVKVGLELSVSPRYGIPDKFLVILWISLSSLSQKSQECCLLVLRTSDPSTTFADAQEPSQLDESRKGRFTYAADDSNSNYVEVSVRPVVVEWIKMFWVLIEDRGQKSGFSRTTSFTPFGLLDPTKEDIDRMPRWVNFNNA